MNLVEFIEKIRELRERGYVKTKRKGDTGVGHTLEQEIGLTENNISGPDLEDIELKSQRRDSSSKITLFTLDRDAWKLNQKDAILKYGYIDTKSRPALKCTVYNKPNSQDLFSKVEADRYCIYHTDGTLIAEWRIDNLCEAFIRKFPNMVLVIAERRFDSNGREEFWYNVAYYLEGVNKSKFIEYLQQDIIVVDLRMHIKKNNYVRNRGTAFRTQEKYLPELFSSKVNLLESDFEKVASMMGTESNAERRKQKRLIDFE
jgi:hypothetical protein